MSSSHATTLHTRHAGLDAQIDAETRRPAPDQAILARLKKQKLRIKEALGRL